MKRCSKKLIPKKAPLTQIFGDIHKYTSRKEMIICGGLSLVMSFLWYFVIKTPADNNGMFIDISLTLIGFSLAAFAILIGSKDIMDKLHIEDNNNCEKNSYENKPIETLFADFMFALLTQCISIQWHVIIKPYNCSQNITVLISLFLFLFEIFWTMHIAIQLYTIRYIITPIPKLPKDNESK